MTSLHRIRVLGRDLQVKSNSLPEKVQEIESFVNRKVAEVAAAVTGGDSQVVAILTLMTLAEAHLSLLTKQETGDNLQVERMDDLIKKIDRCL